MPRKGSVRLTITGPNVDGEYKVIWKGPQGKISEDKSYYSDDEEDIVSTLKSMAVEARRGGYTVQIGGTATTRRLVKRYSRSSEIGSSDNTTLFITSDYSSTGFPLGVKEVKALPGGRQYVK